MDSLKFAIDAIRHSPVLVFDVETSGLDWKRNFVCGYVIGDQSDRHVYLPLRHGGGGNIPDGDHTPVTNESPHRQHAVEALLAEAFDYRNLKNAGPIVGHNLKFDCHFALNHGVKLGRNLVCTQNTQALINEYTKSFSLASLAELYGVEAKKGEKLYEHIAIVTDTTKIGRNTMEAFWQLGGDDALAVEYATGDGVSTLGVYLKQLEEIEDQKLQQIFSLESALIWTLVRLERRGVKIDLEYLDVAREKLAEKVREAYNKLPARKFFYRATSRAPRFRGQGASNIKPEQNGRPRHHIGQTFLLGSQFATSPQTQQRPGPCHTSGVCSGRRNGVVRRGL